MENIETGYGVLKGATDIIRYKSGKLKSCRFEMFNQIATSRGIFTPQYGDIDTRTKFREAISFYETGELKSIYLKERVKVRTVVGLIESEFITFYKNGMVHRIFPLYGQVSGYWSEEEEYQMADKITFNMKEVEVANKVNGYCFYSNGNLKSLSLWNKEVLMAKIHKKNIAVRLGIAFYENGNIKSLEPYVPTMIKTPIGMVMAYNNEPIGVHGDTNSLLLDEEGNIKGITTTSTAVKFKDRLGQETVIAPHLVKSQMDIEQWVIAPIAISFLENQIVIKDECMSYQFNKKDFVWQTEQIAFEEAECKCSNCEGCKSYS